MITTENNFFLLSGKSTSLLLHISDEKKVVTEYFGGKILNLSEALSLSRKYPFAQGSSVTYDEKNPSSCLNQIKADFSTAGRGDFAFPSLVLSNKDGGIFDFVYDSFEIRKPQQILGLPTPHGK